MKKLCYLVCFTFLCLRVSIAAPYSNLIVLGDSQSDIGNFPEASSVTDPDQLPYNLYVPFANPSTTIKYPNLPVQPAINGLTRAGFSRSWVEMLFDTLGLINTISSNILVPWIDVYTYHAPKAASVDYAVAGALSTNHCSNEAYQPFADADCTEENVYATQALYRRSPSRDELRQEVVIPGVQKQISFLAQDLQNQKVHVDANTLYIVWTGANDLALSFTHLLQSKNIKAFYQDMTQTIPDSIAGSQNSIVTQLYALGARNIVILGVQNLGLAPAANIMTGMQQTPYRRYLNAYLLNLLIAHYNLAVAENLVQTQKQYPDLNLTYIDMQNALNRSSMYPSSYFMPTLGLACQSKDAATYQAILAGHLVDCTGYLYWNASHLSHQGQAIVAKTVWQALTREDIPAQSD